MREVFSSAFSNYRQHFWLITSLTLVVWLPYDLVQSYLEYHVWDEEDSDEALNFTIFYETCWFVFSLIICVIPTAGILYSLELSASGVRPTFGSALKAGLAYWPRMFFTYLLLGVLLVCGFIFFIVPAIIVLIRCAVVEQLVVREKLTGMAAITRSYALTKGRFWQLLGWFTVASGGAFLVGAPLLFVAFIPALDWWLPSGIAFTLFGIPLTFTAVFGWAVLNFLQKNELQHQMRPPF